MAKISVTIDVDKIDKSKITSRTYKNKDGQDVTVREYKMDVVELKEPKYITEGDTWKLFKTHFVCEANNDSDAETVFLGDGVVFKNKDMATQAQENLGYGEGSDDEIPF